MNNKGTKSQKSSTEQLLMSLLFVFAAFLISALSPRYISPITPEPGPVVESTTNSPAAATATDTMVARLIRQVPTSIAN